MPAGDLVTGPWQFELRGLLHGDTTTIGLIRVSGLVGTQIEMPESEYAHADGSFLADAHETARTATFEWEIEGTDADDAGSRFISLRSAWAKSSTDLELWWHLPGWGKRYVVGRPVSVVEDMRSAHFGLIGVLCSFRISDPTIHA